MIGGITFTGLTLYSTHLKTAPKRLVSAAESARGLKAEVGIPAAE
jgi:hypothetical protein